MRSLLPFLSPLPSERSSHSHAGCGCFHVRATFRCTCLLVAFFLMPGAADAQILPVYRPAWISTLPVGDDYVYCRGDGVDADIERAQAKARADAIRKAQMAATEGTTGPAVDSVSLTEQKTEILSASSVAFQAARIHGLEWVDDYSEQIATRSGARFHYYCLIRIPKPEPGVFAKLGGGVVGRFDAVFHSAIVPGWGQIRQGRTGTGAFYMLSALGTGLALGTLHVLDNEGIRIGEKERDWGSYKKGAAYAFAGLYALNLVDALVWGRKARNYQVSAAGGRVMMTRRF